MTTDINANFYKKKKTRGIYFSIVFLLIVIVGTIALSFYNKNLDGENKNLLEEISTRETSIKKLKKNKNIEAYHIYNMNRKVLDTLAEKSKIPTFIEHILRTMIHYDLTFENFSYIDGGLTLGVIAKTNEKGLAYSKVIKFIDQYNKSKKWLFYLGEIENFSGQDSIKFQANFTLK